MIEEARRRRRPYEEQTSERAYMNGIDHQARRAMIVMHVRYYDGIVGGIDSQMARQ